MSELQFRDCLEWAKRGPHDDCDVALLWADKRIAELEMMVYLYVDGADIAIEHNPIMRRVIENVQKRER